MSLSEIDRLSGSLRDLNQKIEGAVGSAAAPFLTQLIERREKVRRDGASKRDCRWLLEQEDIFNNEPGLNDAQFSDEDSLVGVTRIVGVIDRAIERCSK